MSAQRYTFPFRHSLLSLVQLRSETHTYAVVAGFPSSAPARPSTCFRIVLDVCSTACFRVSAQFDTCVCLCAFVGCGLVVVVWRRRVVARVCVVVRVCVFMRSYVFVPCPVCLRLHGRVCRHVSLRFRVPPDLHRFLRVLPHRDASQHVFPHLGVFLEDGCCSCLCHGFCFARSALFWKEFVRRCWYYLQICLYYRATRARRQCCY